MKTEGEKMGRNGTCEKGKKKKKKEKGKKRISRKKFNEGEKERCEGGKKR